LAALTVSCFFSFIAFGALSEPSAFLEALDSGRTLLSLCSLGGLDFLAVLLLYFYSFLVIVCCCDIILCFSAISSSYVEIGLTLPPYTLIAGVGMLEIDLASRWAEICGFNS